MVLPVRHESLKGCQATARIAPLRSGPLCQPVAAEQLALRLGPRVSPFRLHCTHARFPVDHDDVGVVAGERGSACDVYPLAAEPQVA